MGLRKAGNLSPDEAIVVENAPMGVQAGKAAGIFTVAVNTGPLEPSVLREAGADIVLSGMEELAERMDEIIALHHSSRG
jgi:beta-phosphoglucomutase-like phosphatase (HAD superfamily)